MTAHVLDTLTRVSRTLASGLESDAGLSEGLKSNVDIERINLYDTYPYALDQNIQKLKYEFEFDFNCGYRAPVGDYCK